MTKKKYHQGQIIRRKCRNNPIGPYMVIQAEEEDRVYADIIGLDMPNIMLLKKNVHIPSINSVCVSEDILERAKKGMTFSVMHEESTRWNNIFLNPPELITLYTIPKNYKATFKVEGVIKMYSMRKMCVKILLERYIL